MLWITGNPACGKSVMARFIADSLESFGKHPKNSHWAPIVCPFFFKDGLEKRDNCASAMSALLHRLFTTRPLLSRLGREEYAAKGSGLAISAETTWRLMCEACGKIPHRPVVCVIDALDECAGSSRDRFIRLMLDTFSSGSSTAAGGLKVLITSRPWPEIEAQFGYDSTIRLRGEDETNAVANDLDMVITHRINELRNKHILNSETSEIVEKVLRDKADGTFLWVSLVLESITSIRSRKIGAIEKKLRAIPKTLDEMYLQALPESDDEEDQEMTQRLLSVLLAATRSLTLDEINVCLNLQEDTKSLARLELEPDIAHTVKTFGGFFVRIVNSEVLLVHQTAREFLVREGPATYAQGWKHSISMLDANHFLALRCLRWLLLHDWSSFIEDMAEVEKQEGLAQRMVAVLPQGQKGFFMYAAANWPSHVKALEGEYEPSSELREAIWSICDFSRTSFSIWWSCYASIKSRLSYPTQSIFLHAATKGDFIVLRALWETNSRSIASHSLGSTELVRAAARYNHLEVLKWAFSSLSLEQLDAGEALIAAAENDHCEAAKLILENTSTDINGQHPFDTALTVATGKGHITFLRHLISRGANPIDHKALTRAVDRYIPGILEFLVDQTSNSGLDERVDLLQKILDAALDGKALTDRESTTGREYSVSIPTSSSQPFEVVLRRGMTLPSPHKLFFQLVEATRNDSLSTIVHLLQEGACDQYAVALVFASRSPQALRTLLDHHEYERGDIWKAFRYLKTDTAAFCLKLLSERFGYEAEVQDSILLTSNISFQEEEKCLHLFLCHLIGIEHSFRLEPLMHLFELAIGGKSRLKPIDIGLQVSKASHWPLEVRTSLLTLAILCKADDLVRSLTPLVNIDAKDKNGMSVLLAAIIGESVDLIQFAVYSGARADTISWYSNIYASEEFTTEQQVHDDQIREAMLALDLEPEDEQRDYMSPQDVLECWDSVWTLLGKDAFIESPRSVAQNEVKVNMSYESESGELRLIDYLFLAKGFNTSDGFVNYKLLHENHQLRYRSQLPVDGEGGYSFFDEVPSSLVLPCLKSASGNLGGCQALHLAAARGMRNLSHELLKRQEQAGAAIDDEGQTPLHAFAQGSGKLDHELLVEMLREGADLEAIDHKGQTPLHLSAQAWGWDAARALIDLGAAVDARDAVGCTPLHLAMETSRDPEGLKFLLQKGADSLATDSYGLTAMHHLINGRPLPETSYVTAEPSIRQGQINRGVEKTIAMVEALTQDMIAHGWSVDDKHADGLTYVEFAEKLQREDNTGYAGRADYTQGIIDVLKHATSRGHGGLDQDDIRNFYESEHASATVVERRASLDESFWNDIQSDDELDLGSSDYDSEDESED